MKQEMKGTFEYSESSDAVDLSRLYLVTDKLDLATALDIRNAERALGATFPAGYAAFVTTIGSGECDSYVRIYSPAAVAGSCYRLRLLFKEYARFWDDEPDTLSEQQLGEVIVIGDTIDTDYLAFPPSTPSSYYILPRYDERTYRIGASLGEALDWLSQSDVLAEPSNAKVLDSSGRYTPHDFHYFDSGLGQSYADFYEHGSNTPALFADVVAHLVEIARHNPDSILARWERTVGDADLRIFRLFMRDAAAMIQAQGSDRYGPRVFTEFDASRVTPTMRDLFAYFEGLGLQHRGR